MADCASKYPQSCEKLRWMPQGQTTSTISDDGKYSIAEFFETYSIDFTEPLQTTKTERSTCTLAVEHLTG